MSKALLPFYVLYVGDGTATSFVLDASKDPFYFANDISSFNAADALPGTTALAGTFDPKDTITGLVSVQAHNASNNSDYGVGSTSIDGYKLTFNLSSIPASGALFAVQGFIEY